MSEDRLSAVANYLPCPVVILSASDGVRQGAMTATAMFVSERPPLLVVSVSKKFATYPVIENAKCFAVNVLADNQITLAARFGSVHGFEVDKFKQFGIETRPGSKIAAPLILGCYAVIECRVRTALWDVPSDRAIYIAEPVAYILNEGLKPMVWLDKNFFKVGAECSI